MLAAMAMFACMDALFKALVGFYPPLQVTVLRGLTAMPLVCAYILWRRETGAVFGRALRWRLHLLGGAIIIASGLYLIRRERPPVPVLNGG